VKNKKICGVAAALAALVFALEIVCAPVLAGVRPVVSRSEEELASVSQRAGLFLRDSKRALDLQTELEFEEDRRFRLNISPRIASRIFYGAIFVVFAVVLLALRDNLWSFSRSRRLGPDSGGESPPPAAASRMENAQVEADELARRGDFAEAMHVLLLQSVSELRRGLAVSIADSLTSREILRRVSLPGEGRSVFSDIISRVEISYFGTHKPEAEDYAACRRSFDTLTDLLRRNGVS
jgi:hypothetical protein